MNVFFFSLKTFQVKAASAPPLETSADESRPPTTDAKEATPAPAAAAAAAAVATTTVLGAAEMLSASNPEVGFRQRRDGTSIRESKLNRGTFYRTESPTSKEEIRSNKKFHDEIFHY